MQKRIVALDVGDRRIGIAVSDPLGVTAQPVETYTRVGYGPDARHIAQLAAQYETDRVLCGLPRNMDGTQGFQAEKVREFAAKLEEQGLNVLYYDERMTTVLAEHALLEANMTRGKRKQKVDMLAAVVILQSYLDAQAAEERPAPEEEPAEEETDDEGLLELEDEEGNVFRYALTAQIRLDGQDYALLTAADLPKEAQEDETLVLLKTQDERGEACYASLEDEDLIARVYEAYLEQNERE